MVTGSGTPSDPFMLYNLSDLSLIGTSGYPLTSSYQLANNIDASATQKSDYNSGSGFTPIGLNNSPFTGNFNGNNFTISNLFINLPSTDNVGLFSNLGSGASVHDLILKGDITGHNQTGSVSGGGNYTFSITNCKFYGSIHGAGSVGGIIGYGNPMGQTITVQNCIPSCTITATGDCVGGIVGYAPYDGQWIIHDITINKGTLTINSPTSNNVGGIAGQLEVFDLLNCYVNTDLSCALNVGGIAGYTRWSGSMSNCYFSGNLVGTGRVGGIVGISNPWGHSISFQKCFSSGSITCNGDYAGGFGGFLLQAGMNYITDCFSSCDVTASGSYIGGFIGYMQATNTTRCYCACNVSGGSNVGGFAGIDGGYGSSATDCFWDTETSGQTVSAFGTGKTTVQIKTQSTYSNYDFNTPVWIIDSSKNGGYPYLSSVPLPVTQITLLCPEVQSSEQFSNYHLLSVFYLVSTPSTSHFSDNLIYQFIPGFPHCYCKNPVNNKIKLF